MNAGLILELACLALRPRLLDVQILPLLCGGTPNDANVRVISGEQ